MRRSLEEGGSPNAVSTNYLGVKGKSPMHIAAGHHTDSSIIELLIRSGGDPKNHMGAVANSRWPFKVPLNAALEYRGDTPLHQAVRNGNAAVARWLVDNAPDAVHERNASNESPSELALGRFRAAPGTPAYLDMAKLVVPPQVLAQHLPVESLSSNDEIDRFVPFLREDQQRELAGRLIPQNMATVSPGTLAALLPHFSVEQINAAITTNSYAFDAWHPRQLIENEISPAVIAQNLPDEYLSELNDEDIKKLWPCLSDKRLTKLVELNPRAVDAVPWKGLLGHVPPNILVRQLSNQQLVQLAPLPLGLLFEHFSDAQISTLLEFHPSVTTDVSWKSLLARVHPDSLAPAVAHQQLPHLPPFALSRLARSFSRKQWIILDTLNPAARVYNPRIAHERETTKTLINGLISARESLQAPPLAPSVKSRLEGIGSRLDQLGDFTAQMVLSAQTYVDRLPKEAHCSIPPDQLFFGCLVLADKYHEDRFQRLWSKGVTVRIPDAGSGYANDCRLNDRSQWINLPRLETLLLQYLNYDLSPTRQSVI